MASEFINGIQSNSNENFRQKYRNIDILIIDDIQFLAGKEGIQEEFFHTFNALRENNSQIILTSNGCSLAFNSSINSVDP